MTVAELIEKLNAIEDKNKTVYVDLYENKFDELRHIYNVDDFKTNINLTTYESF